jgi:hypothetical protein
MKHLKDFKDVGGDVFKDEITDVLKKKKKKKSAKTVKVIVAPILKQSGKVKRWQSK